MIKSKYIHLALITLKGGIRDRTFFWITLFSLSLFLSTTLFSAFSLRQVTAVAIDYNLSVISFTGLLLVLFLGIQTISKDIDNRSVYSVASLPLSRSQFLLGKFLGFILLIFIIICIFSMCGLLAIAVTNYMYPQGIMIYWTGILTALFCIYIKLTLISSVTFLISSIATSTLLPLFVTVTFYFIGESIEEVMFYINGIGANKVSPILKKVAFAADYIFPNLSALDYKTQAIYGIAINFHEVTSVTLYALLYIFILLSLSTILFEKREFL